MWHGSITFFFLLCYFVHRSSCSHTCDAFQLAHASFRLYCVRNNYVLASNSQKAGGKPGPQLLGDRPQIDITLPEEDVQDEESSSGSLPAIKIYDDDVTMRFLVCGLPCTLVYLVYIILSILFVGCLNKLLVSFIEYVLVSILNIFRMHSYWDLWRMGSMLF